MGFFENMMNSITGSDNSRGDFNDEKYDSSFTSGGQGRSSGNEDLRPEDPSPPEQNGPAPGNPAQSQSQGNNQPSPPGGEEMGDDFGSRNGSPAKKPGSSNPQAGRPEPGSSEPQVSDETRREMEDAGFNLNEGNRGRIQNGQGSQGGSPMQGSNSTEPVSSQRDDIEEIKSQNEQIIELLKRISDSLQRGSERGSTGGDRRGPSRHGGRR